MSAYADIVQNFKCTCLDPCSEKTLQLTVHRTPVTFDLNSAASASQGTYATKTGCMQPYDEQRRYPIALATTIVLFKAEQIREETVIYTQLMALADVYNTIGLFFGLCVLSMYETFEETLLVFRSQTSKLDSHGRDTRRSKVEHQHTSFEGPGLWYALAVRVQKFRYLIGHQVGEDAGSISASALVQITVQWILLWLLLAAITIEQVFIFAVID
jgi:hypothetical protein